MNVAPYSNSTRSRWRCDQRARCGRWLRGRWLRGLVFGVMMLSGVFLSQNVVWAKPHKAGPHKAGPLKSATLLAARACAARADSSCVIKLLQSTEPTAQGAAEHWLALAFAWSRQGVRDKAQAAFRTWLALSSSNRLDRGQVPSRIWPDYVAALLAHHGGALDLQPKVMRTPRPDTVKGSWRDLPAMPPPPRSSRDRARDAEFVLGPAVGWRVGDGTVGDGGVAVGLDVLIRLKVAAKLQVGVGITVLSMATSTDARELAAAIGIQVQRTLVLWPQSRLAVDILLGGGLLQAQGVQRTNGLIAPGLRYAWLPTASSMGIEIGLADRIWVSGGGTVHTPMVSVGLLLLPGRGKAKKKRAARSTSLGRGQP